MPTTRALHWAMLGRIGNAMKALSSSGVANPEDSAVQAEIRKRHPEGPVLLDSDLPDLPPAITVTAQLVFKALKAFPIRALVQVVSSFGLNTSWMWYLVLLHQ